MCSLVKQDVFLLLLFRGCAPGLCEVPREKPDRKSCINKVEFSSWACVSLNSLSTQARRCELPSLWCVPPLLWLLLVEEKRIVGHLLPVHKCDAWCKLINLIIAVCVCVGRGRWHVNCVVVVVLWCKCNRRCGARPAGFLPCLCQPAYVCFATGPASAARSATQEGQRHAHLTRLPRGSSTSSSGYSKDVLFLNCAWHFKVLPPDSENPSRRLKLCSLTKTNLQLFLHLRFALISLSLWTDCRDVVEV